MKKGGCVSMRKKWWSFFVVSLMLFVLILLSGCLGGGGGKGGSEKTFTLEVTILNKEFADQPISGAVVSVTAGSKSIEHVTNAHGKASFPKLSGKVEVLVEAVGYQSKQKEWNLTENKKVSLQLDFAETTKIVADIGTLQDALADPKIEVFFLKNDLSSNEIINITKPIKLDLNGKIFASDVLLDFAEEGKVEIAAGEIAGTLTIDTPLATIYNYAKVAESIIINQLAPASWHEYADGNEIIVEVGDVHLYIHQGARLIQFSHVEEMNKLSIEGTVERLLTFGPLNVTGGNKIIHATVDSLDVVFDYAPERVDGSSTPTITNPNKEPDNPPQNERAFEPGSGGTIPHFPIQSTSADFVGLFASRTQGYYPEGSTEPVFTVQLWHPSLEELGDLAGNYFALEYSTDGNSWEAFLVDGVPFIHDHPTYSAFEIEPDGDYYYRLQMVGGPLDGGYSNIVYAALANIPMYYNGMRNVYQQSNFNYIDPNLTCEVSLPFAWRIVLDENLNEVTEQVVDSVSYQWYRVHPDTYEFTKVKSIVLYGNRITEYIPQEKDAGYYLVAKTIGDGIDSDGFAQTISQEPVRIRNRGFVENINANGFDLILEKSPSRELVKEDLVLQEKRWFGKEPVFFPIKRLTSLDTTRAAYRIEVDGLEFNEMYELDIIERNWILVPVQGLEETPVYSVSIFYNYQK